MSFRKKIALGVISAVCAFAFVACGNSSGTPQCDDKDVPRGLLEDEFRRLGVPIANENEKDLKSLASLLKLQNVTTEKVDEAKKR